MEAPTRFELVMRVLQTRALPLGDGATRIKLRIISNTFILYMKIKKIATLF